MTSAFMICKALLERCPVDEQSALLALLPNEARKELEQLPSASLPTPGAKISDPLTHIHPSWLAPFLRTLAKHDLKLFLAALNKDQREPLMQQLGFSDALPTLSHSGKQFARRFLLNQLLHGHDILLPPFTPPSAIRSLIQMSAHRLLTVMQYLGLYDLAFEMRQIIDTAQLNKVLGALHDDEIHFMKQVSEQGNPIIFKRLFLRGWDGKRTTLLHLLQERGMQRLALALYEENASLVWIVTHALEMTTATKLLKLRTKPSEKRMPRVLAEQVSTVLSTLGKP